MEMSHYPDKSDSSSSLPSLLQKSCPICSQSQQLPVTGIDDKNKKQFQVIIKLLNIMSSSGTIVRKTLFQEEQWSFCGGENCQQFLNNVIQLFQLIQQFSLIKEQMEQCWKTLFMNWKAFICDDNSDREGWRFEQLQRIYSLDRKTLSDFFRDEDQSDSLSLPLLTTEISNKDIKDDDMKVETERNKLLESESLQGQEVNTRSRGKRKKTKKVDTTIAKPGQLRIRTTRSMLQSTVPNPVNPSPPDTGSKSCDKCEKTFLTATSLRTHKRTHVREGRNKDGTFHCTHCSAILLSLSELKEHRNKEHEQPRDFCPICRKQMSKGFLQQHLHSHMNSTVVPMASFNDTILCAICTKPFHSALLLSSHMDVHKGDYSCEVPTCRKSFYSLRAKMKHVESIHTVLTDNASSARQDCMYCFQTFDHEEEFLLHVEKHEDQTTMKKLLCENCGTYFRSNKSLHTHLRLNHPKSRGIKEPEPNKCEICDKSFVTSQRLKVHMLSHKNPATSAPFTCPEPQCGKVFNQKVSLKSHLMVHHSSEMRYKCTLCEHPGFTYSQGLRSHVYKTHNEVYTSSERKHVCGVCYKNFLTEDELVMHIGNHDKLKCQLCSKQFKSMNHLKEHTLRHASIRPFKCHHCPSKGYVRQTQLNEHMRKVHQQSDSGPPLSQLQQQDYVIGHLEGFPEQITYIIQIP